MFKVTREELIVWLQDPMYDTEDILDTLDEDGTIDLMSPFGVEFTVEEI